MCKRIAFLTAVLLCLITSSGYGQLDGLYEFDGDVDGAWENNLNWEQVLDPNGNPISGDPPTPPSVVTSADIPLTGVDSSGAGNTALDVNIGTANGVGGLGVSAGDLTTRDVFVGRDATNGNMGTLDVTGGTLNAGDDITVGGDSTGVMNLSSGAANTDDDFVMSDNGSLNLTGGTLTVGDNFQTIGGATILVDGGNIKTFDDFRWDGTNVQATVNSGFVEIFDKLRFDETDFGSSKLTINGGTVRSEEYGLDVDVAPSTRGLIEINGDGVYEVESNKLSVQEARALIAEGVHLITSEPAPLRLGAVPVLVPEFFGETNLIFTQILVVPEPASAMLLGFATISLLGFRRRRA